MAKVKAPKNPPTPQFLKDLGGAGDAISQNWDHGAKQIADFSDGISNYFGLGPAPDISLTGFFRNIGKGYKEPQQAATTKKASTPAKAANVIPRGKSGAVPKNNSPLTFQDYLDLAGKLGLGSNGVDYSGEKAALTQQAGAADTQLAAMYNALRGSYAKDAPGIAASYDASGNAIANNGDQAAKQIGDAYQAARDAQTQQLAALGIQDAVGSLGGRAASDQAQAVSNVRQNQDANAQQNQQGKQAAATYNTGIQDASALAGAENRFKIQQQLVSGLANLDAQQAAAGAQGNQNLLNGAFQLAQNASLVDPHYANTPAAQAAQAKADLANQAAAASLYGQQLKNQQLAANSSTSSPNLSQIMALASKNGVTISNASDLAKFVAALKQSNQF